MRKCLIISDFKPEVLLIPGVFLAFWVMSSKYCSGYHLPSPRSVSPSLAKETWNVCIWINTCHFYKYLLMSTSISSFETCSVTQLCPMFCNPVDCSTLGFSVFHHLLEPAQTHVYWVDDAIQPSHPLSSPSPPASLFPNIRVFSNELALRIRWPKYWSFSFSINPSNEHSRLISTSDHKMRTFGPQLRNKDSQRAIRPRVVTCVLPSPAARGQGEAQREPDGSAPGWGGPFCYQPACPTFLIHFVPSWRWPSHEWEGHSSHINITYSFNPPKG